MFYNSKKADYDKNMYFLYNKIMMFYYFYFIYYYFLQNKSFNTKYPPFIILKVSIYINVFTCKQ